MTVIWGNKLNNLCWNISFNLWTMLMSPFFKTSIECEEKLANFFSCRLLLERKKTCKKEKLTNQIVDKMNESENKDTEGWVTLFYQECNCQIISQNWLTEPIFSFYECFSFVSRTTKKTKLIAVVNSYPRKLWRFCCSRK